MTRRFVSAAFALLLALTGAQAQNLLAQGPRGVFTNLHAYRAPSGRTLVPLRGVGEFCGASVGFQNKTVTLQKGGTTVTLRLGSKEATVSTNGRTRTVRLQEPARAIDGITLVPLRFVGEALGCGVEYRKGEHSGSFPTPHIALSSGGKSGWLVVHDVPPSKVDAIRRASYPRDADAVVARSPYQGYVFVVGLNYTGDTDDPLHGWRGLSGYLIRQSNGGWRYLTWSGMDALDAGWESADFMARAREAGVPDDVIRHYYTLPKQGSGYGVSSPMMP